MLYTTIVLLAVSLAGATSGFAQAIDGSLLPTRELPVAQHALVPPELADRAAREGELTRWVERFTAWEEWFEQWGNRREPGWFNASRERRQRPDPPAWLFAQCADSPDESTAVIEACARLAEWKADYPVAHVASTRAAAVNGSEDGEKITWWEHVHFDAVWPALQSSSSVFGVIGMHVTTTVKGRLEIFIAPGAMLLNVPDGYGGRMWKLATNYGIAYRLGEFKFPGNRRALLHLNLAKAWLLAAGNVQTQSTDFAGLSITFKKTPPPGAAP
jgi:hypothetical protein